MRTGIRDWRFGIRTSGLRPERLPFEGKAWVVRMLILRDLVSRIFNSGGEGAS